MANIIVGTAGHIDHGKTTLIKALSGIETDTTTEEKERGMSINLGFAYFDLPSGKRCGVVDVPGHEKFIKNMLAGVSGINLVLLLIDSREGIMPQTKEHVDILTLLGIKDYIIVMTKKDLVEKEYREMIKEDIIEFIKDTPLEKSKIIEVDSISKEGIDTLIKEIDSKVKDIKEKEIKEKARLNIDRTFQIKGFGTVVTGTLTEGKLKVGDEIEIYPKNIKTKIRNIQVHSKDVKEATAGQRTFQIKGFGTVVTGTLTEGKLKVGDEIEIYPKNIKTKIRNIQVHSKDVKEATAGQRTAINLTNVKKEDVERGCTLATPNSLIQTYMLDAEIMIIKDTKYTLELWDRVRIYIGTKEVMARVVPLGIEKIKKGEKHFAQLRLEEEISIKNYDKFIIRTYSPMETIGGGVVVDPAPKKHKRYNETILTKLKNQAKGSLKEIITNFLITETNYLLPKEKIIKNLEVAKCEIEKELENLKKENKIIQINENYIHIKKYQDIKEKIYSEISYYHQKYRLRLGIPIVELISKIKINKKETQAIIEKLIEQKELRKQGNFISFKEFKIVYDNKELKDKEKIEKILLQSGLKPQPVSQIIEKNKINKELVESLVGNTLIKLNDEIYIHMKTYQDAVKQVKEHFKKEEKLTLAEFRDMSGSSRKYTMAILEYMDKKELTKRVENYRIKGKNME